MLSLWFYGLVDTAYNLLSQLNFPSPTRLSEVFCQVVIADKLPVKNKNNEWVTALILEEDNLTVAFYDFGLVYEQWLLYLKYVKINVGCCIFRFYHPKTLNSVDKNERSVYVNTRLQPVSLAWRWQQEHCLEMLRQRNPCISEITLHWK